MTMPKWHETMRPVMDALAAADVLTSAELMNVVVVAFSMTEGERAERLKSGQLRVYNRMYWGITDLEKAKFLKYGKKRGTYSITDAGRQFLGAHEGPITAADLDAASTDFRNWRKAYREKEGQVDGTKPADASDVVEESASPQEQMERAYDEMRDALANQLLQTIVEQSPYFFEHLVGKLLEAMGYGESLDNPTTVTPKSGDEGIDGVVKEDRLGFDSVYYQAKCWKLDSVVGAPDIQGFVGALSGKGATRGLFITTAKFSKKARQYAEGLHNQKVVLVDGKALANLMIDYGVGVSTVSTYEVKAMDSDFFAEG